MSSLDFIDLFTSKIETQKSDTIIERNFECVSQCINLFTPEKYRKELSTRLFYFCFDFIRKTSTTEENRLVTLRNYLIEFAENDLSLKIIQKWMDGEQHELKDYPLSLTNKWSIIHKQLGFEEINKSAK